MSADLPRLGGLAEPEKYDRLVTHVPDVWWSGAGPFQGLHELNAARVDYFRGVLGGFAGKRALDVGCGGGLLAEALARDGALVTAIDPSEKTLQVARSHAAAGGLAIDYRLASAEELATWNLDRPFDLVFAVDVLEHVADLETTLAGIGRVLRPGGAFGFLTHNRTPAAFLRLIWSEEYVERTMPEGFHEFARFIAPGELADGLARYGLAVQELKGLAPAGDGGARRILTEDVSVTYIGWALRAP